MNYKLKSGQINFENLDNPGAYSCVVIKNGEFHNLTDDLRRLLLNALQPATGFELERSVLLDASERPENPIPNLEDMF